MARGVDSPAGNRRPVPALVAPSRWTRWALIGAGTAVLGVGILGIFLPLLPTTPFLLLAAACFVRSSPRLHDWLLNNRWTGVYIRHYREGGTMPTRVKVMLVIMLWVSLAASAYFVPNPWIWAILASVAIGVPWLVFTDARLW